MFCFVYFKTIAIECDKNGLDGMFHLGVRQLVTSLSNSVLCARWMSIPKTFDEEINGLQEQMGVADFSGTESVN